MANINDTRAVNPEDGIGQAGESPTEDNAITSGWENVNMDDLDIPGTEVLTKHEGSRDKIILVPHPRNDVHDPLNWSRGWKYAVLANMLFLMFMGNFSPLSIAPLTPILMEQFDTSVSKVAALTGACILALGYANFIIIPCANIFGRRPVALVCMLISIGANIWQAASTSYSSLLGARVLIGIGAASSESLMPVVISDMTFLHERGTWMGAYFWVYFMGGFLGPIVSGSIAASVSWRWFFWLSVILDVVSFIGMVIALPETKYRGPGWHNNGSVTETEEAQSIPSNDGEKTKMEATEMSALENQTHTNGEVQNPFLGRGYPSRSQRWGVLSKPDPAAVKLLHHDVVTPLYMAFFPIALFAALAVMAGACSLLVLNLTESQGFSRPPYNFSPGAVGFSNFALMIGGIVGLSTAGPLSDWISMFLTKRNNGVREPEMRLVTLIPFVIITVIGMTVSAVGFEHLWPWEVVVIVGFGLSGVIVMAIPTIATTYAIDSYKPVAGELMVLVTIAKNTFGYGMTYFINPWLEQSGFFPPIFTVGMLAVGISTVGGIFFYFFGKTCRRWTKNSKLHGF